jgi:hypothetical protein
VHATSRGSDPRKTCDSGAPAAPHADCTTPEVGRTECLGCTCCVSESRKLMDDPSSPPSAFVRPRHATRSSLGLLCAAPLVLGINHAQSSTPCGEATGALPQRSPTHCPRAKVTCTSPNPYVSTISPMTWCGTGCACYDASRTHPIVRARHANAAQSASKVAHRTQFAQCTH